MGRRLSTALAALRRNSFDDLSIRNKLLAMVLLPLLVVLPLLGLILLWWGNAAFDQLVVTKIRSDLAVANGYFERVLGEVGASTAAVADSHALQQAMAAPQADLARENERLRLENRILKEERDILKKATQFFASQRP